MQKTTSTLTSSRDALQTTQQIPLKQSQGAMNRKSQSPLDKSRITGKSPSTLSMTSSNTNGVQQPPLVKSLTMKKRNSQTEQNTNAALSTTTLSTLTGRAYTFSKSHLKLG